MLGYTRPAASSSGVIMLHTSVDSRQCQAQVRHALGALGACDKRPAASVSGTTMRHGGRAQHTVSGG